MALPVNIDTTYDDDAGDATVKEHQQHHDTLHATVNALTGDTVSAPASVDGVTAAAFINQTNADVNGFVVKVAGGVPSTYGRGQAFMVLEEGVGDATDQTGAGSVLFRIDENGGMGVTGSVHVASGLRKSTGATQAVWIDPSENMAGLVIHSPSVAESATWDKNYLQIVDVRNANAQVFVVNSAGNVQSTGNITARLAGVEQAIIGSAFGAAGLLLGSATDTMVYRDAAGIAEIFDTIQLREKTTPAAPAANKARIFVKDNGSGKTQLCVIFNTGAVQVIATQP